jgi:hypothetical protein
VTTPCSIRPLWTSSHGRNLRGLVQARERGWLLVWDAQHWIYLLNHWGKLQGQVQPHGHLTTACCADDGSAFAAAGSRGEIWWLARDLTISWEQGVGQRILAAAMDPFGQYLAVADAGSQLHLLDRRGQRRWQVAVPRPLHHLAFVPAAPFLIGSSDYGLVACLDFLGQWVWRDGLVAHIGALAVSGAGDQIVLACFTEGLHRYGLNGAKQERQAGPEPCRLAALAFDGQRTLVAGLSHRLHLLPVQGGAIGTYSCDQSPVAVALGALGDLAVVALADGTLIGLEIGTEAVRQ